jgi:hypothetical protein
LHTRSTYQSTAWIMPLYVGTCANSALRGSGVVADVVAVAADDARAAARAASR